LDVEVLALALVLVLVERVLDELPQAASTRLARTSRITAAVADLCLLLLG
jgi:hypothetical protein